MFMKTILGAILLAAAGLAHSQDGKALYSTCAACHGQQAEGVPAMHAPALAGQSASYLARQLMHFKNGLRGSDSADIYGQQMRGMAATLPDQAAIDAVSSYIAALPRTAPTATLTGNTDAGYKQYNMKCGACHGGKAEGNEALNAPALAGVGDAYLQHQFAAFKAGHRGTAQADKYGRQMAMMVNTVTEQELIDLLSYINTLK